MAQDKCSRHELRQRQDARVMISSPLKLPPGKSFPTIVLRFDPAEVGAVVHPKPHNCHDLAAEAKEPHGVLFVPATGLVGKASGDQYKSRPIGQFGNLQRRNPGTEAMTMVWTVRTDAIAILATTIIGASLERSRCLQGPSRSSTSPRAWSSRCRSRCRCSAAPIPPTTSWVRRSRASSPPTSNAPACSSRSTSAPSSSRA